MISIIVPTFREAPNIPILTERIDKSMKSARLDYNIIIVDDNSNDGIVEAVEHLKRQKFPITIEVRLHERGLSSAVIKGFSLAQGDIIVVMDADLSHPPEKIPELISQITEGNAEFAIGSRFVRGGSASHFNWYRRLNAWVSKILARPLTRVTDPMAGFFCFSSSILSDISMLNPIGFKIGLEVIVKCRPKKILEIPIEFRERLHGESKLSLKEQVNYLIHLARLFEYKYPSMSVFIKLTFIGTIGLTADLTCMYITYEEINVPFRIARAISSFVAVLMIIFMSKRYILQQTKDWKAGMKYVFFFSTALLAFGLNWLISVYLYENCDFFNRFYLFAVFIGIMGGLLTIFSGSKLIEFKR